MRLHSLLGLALLLICALAPSASLAQTALPLEELVKAAEHGDANAQFQLAQRYGEGSGVERDGERALTLMLAAAEGGHLEAQAALGLHFTGEAQDATANKLGMQWLRRAAERGHPIAAMQLGVMAVDAGQGAQALPWFRIAADSGDRDIQRAFSDMLEKGEGVPRDEAEAYFWYLVAAPPDRVETAEETALGRRLGARTADAMAVKADAWRARALGARPAVIDPPSPVTGLEQPDHARAATGPAATGFLEMTYWDYREEGDERPPIARRQRFDLRDAVAYRESPPASSGAAAYIVLEISTDEIDRAQALRGLHVDGGCGLGVGLCLHLNDDGTLRSGLIGHPEGLHEIRSEVVATELNLGADAVIGRVHTTAPASDSDWRDYRFDIRIHAARVDTPDVAEAQSH